MSAYLTQASFNAGELSPLMAGRVDQERRGSGCAVLLNFNVWPQGPAFRRPGMRFIFECANPAVASHLVRFEFSVSAGQTYMLEFYLNASGQGKMRVHLGGDSPGPVLSGGIPYEIDIPYTSMDDIRALRFCQSADVMYITHPAYAPQKLSRLGHTNWTIASVVFGPSISAPTGGSVVPQGTTGSTTYTYVVTAVKDETDEESVPSSEKTTASGNATLSGTNFNRVTWAAVSGAKEYNVYREKNGVFGWIGVAEGTTYDDKGEKTPDTDDTAPKFRNPFSGSGDKPKAAQFFEQRLMFARSNNAPQKIWGSQSANYENFNVSNPLKDDDAVTYDIAADNLNEIVWLATVQRKLLIGTVGAEWTMSGSGGDPLTPSSVETSRETVHGSADIAPLPTANAILFVQRPGNVVRELMYTLDTDGYMATDLSVLAEHMLHDRRIASWVWQQSPAYTVWMACDDGTLLSMAYIRDQKVVGWSRHETSGTVACVASIPGLREDEVWFVVGRVVGGETRYYLERLDEVFRGGHAEDAFFVDSGLSANAWNMDGELSMSLAAESWTHGEAATLSAIGHSPFTSEDVGRRYRLRSSLATGDMDPGTACEVEITTFTAAGEVGVRLLTDVPGALQGVATSHWAKLSTFISGLDHLQGRSVQVLADGMVQPEVTVGDSSSVSWASREWASGEIELQRPAAIVHAGIGYVSDLQTMQPETQDQIGSTIGRTRRINAVNVRMLKTLGLQVGPDEAHLQDVMFRTSDMDMGAAVDLFTGDKRVPFNGGSGRGLSVLVRQDSPLPMTILAITMQLQVES
ncbi:hypothetical protein dsx2_2644 [Desulfovibrio sp. X2]|uniref:hypothetical protein n=1 Tax=Desulfovibrio sp. X2 TaxID=941449 RepID=UPI000358D650|nr:hypothetical protein [Desulfovibrio sp. X2]EPR42727.1 hypothetical protein dsx2_2644 [Desulfovibrio sp. X2]